MYFNSPNPKFIIQNSKFIICGPQTALELVVPVPKPKKKAIITLGAYFICISALLAFFLMNPQ